MRKQEKAGGAKTKDGSLEKHRKHLPASSLPQSRAAQHQEGSRRGILPCREKERRRPPQSHHSRGLQPVLSRIPQSSSKLNSTDSHPESPLLTHLLKEGPVRSHLPANGERSGPGDSGSGGNPSQGHGVGAAGELQWLGAAGRARGLAL